MPRAFTADDSLAPKLPLPLAQLHRRAQNAKTPLERHLSAFYFWEAGLKLLSATAVVDYAALSQSNAGLAEELKNLARPTLGHWWKFARRLVPILADANIAGWPALRELFLGRARDDLPRAAGLDAVLIEVLQDKHAGRATVRLTELFDRLVQYRNGVLGHAAPGQLKDEFNERLGRSLLAGIGEVWEKLDVLAGRRLVYVPEVRPAHGAWLVQRYELAGEAPRRLEALELPRDADPPDQQAVYLSGARDSLLSLHPLVLFDFDAEHTLFLNARRGQTRVEYLCYTTGRVSERADLGPERRELLARLLKMPVTSADDPQWTESPGTENAPSDSLGAKCRTLGEFDLLSELGRGGMGVVYRAWQPSLGRQVALKKLLPSADLHRAEERFRREIRALGRVDHPHLVKVFTSGSDGDDWYFAMELVEGAPLADVCATLHAGSPDASTVDMPAWHKCVSSACAKVRDAEKPLSSFSRDAERQRSGARCDALPTADSGSRLNASSPGRDYISQIVELTRQTAEAAHALHENGIIHRDIKPGNILLDRDGGRATLMDLGLAQIADEVDGRLTRTRQFVGTLRYASPEQVLSVGKLDRRSDVYSLGATLWELLTLRPLFGATDLTPTPQLMLDIQNREPDRLRKVNPSVSRDLEAVVHKCLEKRPEDRYATARDLADDLRRVLDGEPVLARPVGGFDRAVKWVKRRPMLAGLYTAVAALVAVLIGSVIIHQRQEITQQQQREVSERQARAAEKVDALTSAEIASVPLIIWDLESLRVEAAPILRSKYAAAATGSPARFRLALALLPADAGLVDELLAYVATARAEEVLVLREALRNHADRVRSLWPRLESAEHDEQMRLAALLAGFVPADQRWEPVIGRVAVRLATLEALELPAWLPAFEPLRGVLSPKLCATYGATQRTVKSNEFTDVHDLARWVSALDRAATLLDRFAADDVDGLTRLLQIADPRHYAGFLKLAKACHQRIAPALHVIVDSKPKANAQDDAKDDLAMRRANAAAALIAFGAPEDAWKMLQQTPDPTARSYLLHALGPRQVDPVILIRRYETENDISARRALLLALAAYDPEKLPWRERETFSHRLVGEFRDHSDAGLHGAIDWLLRQKWGKKAELDQIVSELAQSSRERERPESSSGAPVNTPVADAPGSKRKDWFVNKQGQTFTIIRDPVEFMMGSPEDEPERERGWAERQVPTKIARSFAISAREVTVVEYLRFNEKFRYEKQWAQYEDGPINRLTWYEAAAYCRWLSEQEGVPEDQMCYPPVDQIRAGAKLADNFLDRTGYRLPTEAEWEYACRAGAVTARPYGRGTELLGQYAWNIRNARERLWPCARLKPNDFGLFDMLGNAWEWCQDAVIDEERSGDDRRQVLTLSNDQWRARRGGTFDFSSNLRCARRIWNRSDGGTATFGVRPARTIR